MTMDPSPHPPEVQRFGKYEVLGKIGTGGMAEIFKCRLSGIGGFDKVVVVKRMLPDLLEDKELVRMFLDEARIAATLSHPNIVQIYEIDQVGDTPYIAMEYARGPTLSKVIHEAWKQNKPVARVATKVLSEIAGALAHAHSAVDHQGRPLEIVHRDVTPHNIVVSTEGVAKLLDFGVAKASGRLSTTNAGGIKGKFRYMAPEQLRGDDFKVDGRADVFAVGVCLYLAATGSHAYPARNEIAVLKAAAAGAFPRPSKVNPSIDPDLEKIILWAMHPSLEKRCPNAHELQQALDAYVSQGAERVTNHQVGRYLRYLFGDLSQSNPTAWAAYNDEAVSSRRFSSPITDHEVIEDAVDAAANDGSESAPLEIELADLEGVADAPIVPGSNMPAVAGPSAAAAERSQPGRVSAPRPVEKSQSGRASAPRPAERSQTGRVRSASVAEVAPAPTPRRFSARTIAVLTGTALWLAGLLAFVIWTRLSESPEPTPPATAREAPPAPPSVEDRAPTPRAPAAPVVVAASELRPAPTEPEPERRVPPKAQGRLTVVTDTPARVLIDGRLEGTSPIKSRALAAEGHRVEVQAHGFPPQQRAVTVVADREVQVTFRFGKRPSAVAGPRGGRASPPPVAAAATEPEEVEPEPAEEPARAVVAPAPTPAPSPSPPTAEGPSRPTEPASSTAEAKSTPPPPTPAPAEGSGRAAYDGPISSCPEGASLAGAAPPGGTALWCQLASGAKHGAYVRWFATGQRAETGEYMNGKRNGRWVEFYQDGSERERTQWRRGVKTW